MPAPTKIIKIYSELSSQLDQIEFQEPTHFVYNPLVYARKTHDAYLRKFAKGPKKNLFLGMNPGPWGMAQTGVPFGDPEKVIRFLSIKGQVDQPESVHPKRPILGFASQRNEVSGQRLWSWVENRFKTAEQFFQDSVILNYCPLIFLEESGRNRTPDKLNADERAQVEDLCDESLRQAVAHMKIKQIIGVGKWAARRAEKAGLAKSVRIDSILHPSPASPAANRGWAEQVEQEIKEKGLLR